MLFIDNPVGAGFSYAEANEYYNRMNAEIAADLLTVMKDFYNMFPKFVDTPTYIVSESYGGKVTVEFANVWYKVSFFFNIYLFQHCLYRILRINNLHCFDPRHKLIVK